MRTGRFTYVLLGLLVLIILCLSGFIISCNRKSPERPDRLSPEFIIEQMAEKLDMTEAQVDSLKQIQNETKLRREEIFGKDKGRFSPMIFFDIVVEGESKKQEFEDTLDTFREKMITMDLFTAGQMQKIHYLLDQEQREKLKEFVENFMKENFDKRSGKHPRNI